MLIDLLDEAGGVPDALALVGVDASWTYRELDRAVSERADALVAEGVQAGQIVPVSMDASADAVILLLALWRAGVTPAPLNSGLTAVERDAAEHALMGVETQAQVVLWTSGTDGRPRGVEISYRNLAASAIAAQRRLGLGPSDIWLASLSPAHVGGLVLIARALLLGSRLVAIGAFDAKRTLELVGGQPGEEVGGWGRRAPVTHLSVVPTQLLRLLDLSAHRAPPQTFRCALVGGAQAPDGLVRRALDAGWPVALTYGLTEATSQVATAPPELVERKPGTVGEPLEGVEVRLADDGEVLVRGPTVVSGYLSTAGVQPTSRDGWLHTGDLGRTDEDGHLWIIGRRSDRIVTGGVTVDAVEVEEALRSHDAVADACVVGLPDAEWGERVAAWIVPGDEAPDTDQLGAFLRVRLAGPKLPRVLYVGGDLPRNANGKVDRGVVRSVLKEAVWTA